jgi:hypothetical protein
MARKQVSQVNNWTNAEEFVRDVLGCPLSPWQARTLREFKAEPGKKIEVPEDLQFLLRRSLQLAEERIAKK